TISVIGVLAGVETKLSTVTFMMRRQRLQGILVGSRAAFERMVAFLDEHGVRPVIDRRFAFDELPAALEALGQGRHFGKIVIAG
ncbi:MAG: NAD(P)-dependent alcohol dehydrogenase, partial [Acidobacteria bacterium]